MIDFHKLHWTTTVNHYQQNCLYWLRDALETHVPVAVLAAYQLSSLSFGPDYIIPKPLDPRLLHYVSTAVKEAALAES